MPDTTNTLTANISNSARNFRGRLSDGKPNPIDVYVGSRIKLRRNMLRFSQETLARAMGLTFQQIQKYEKGSNRISASRLWNFAHTLAVPVQFFYEGINENISSQSPRMLYGTIKKIESKEKTAENVADNHEDPLWNSQNLILINAFHKIPNRKTADYIYNLILELGRQTK